MARRFQRNRKNLPWRTKAPQQPFLRVEMIDRRSFTGNIVVVFNMPTPVLEDGANIECRLISGVDLQTMTNVGCVPISPTEWELVLGSIPLSGWWAGVVSGFAAPTTPLRLVPEVVIIQDH